jgi:hypothetical protein
MKSALLQTLGGNENTQKDKYFLMDICLCISAIATVEVPVNEWPEFIETMTEQGN